VEGTQDSSPKPIYRNSYFSLGSKIYGQGFIFDDRDVNATPQSERFRIIEANPALVERILPYLGGEEINQSPTQEGYRFVIQVSDIETEQQLAMMPDLYALLKAKVWPERMKLGTNPNNVPLKRRWWAYQAHRPKLYAELRKLNRVICISRVTPHLSFCLCCPDQIFSEAVCIIASSSISVFAALQSRAHEVWTRFFASTLEDRLRYTPSDCFRTFPFPENFESDSTLEAAGEAYHTFRANLMIERSEGLTKTYNRFHARGENARDIAQLRRLHAEMDAAVLRAYGWDDLAYRAAAEFIEQDADEVKTPKTRLDWPAEFKDEVLARLLALNAERAAAERVAGLTAVLEDEEDDID
jgi:hypothetical protein